LALVRNSEYRRAVELCYIAWTIIANAGDGNWERESEEWQEAAKRWRDEFHAELGTELGHLAPAER
jgi:hypothetical protein